MLRARASPEVKVWLSQNVTAGSGFGTDKDHIGELKSTKNHFYLNKKSNMKISSSLNILNILLHI